MTRQHLRIRAVAYRWRPGFTIVETLAVIVIMAFLVFFLLPELLSPLSTHRNVPRATCASNLHVMAIALKLYRDDHGDYPEALYGFTDPAPSREFTFLYPQYVKEKQLFRCPKAPCHLTDTRTVPGQPPTFGFHKYPGRRYHAWDSYDGQFEPAEPTSPYRVKYVTHWSLNGTGAGGSTRQLGAPQPAEDTVVTWCTYHRDYRGDEVQAGSLDLVLFLDGHVRLIPSTRMTPMTVGGRVPPGRGYLVGRDD
jgi:type II secretory pathway pseudopilin PulG